MTYDVHGISDPGGRQENQDRILVEPRFGLYCVCDGMGGQKQGGLAAELASAAILHYVERSNEGLDITWPFGFDMNLSIDANRLATAIRLANRQIWRQAESSIEASGMGAAVAAVLITAARSVVAHAGDSRVYHFRAGTLKALTRDDTIVAEMIAKGVLRPEQMKTHPMRHILTQAAGSRAQIEPHIVEQDLEAGDTLLMCSDGLHSDVGDEQISSILSTQDGAEAVAKKLIDAAINSKSNDNVSVVVVRVV
jgi:protein phosphatase